MNERALRKSAAVPRLRSPREAVGRVGERSEPGWGVAQTKTPPTPDPSPPLRFASRGEGSATAARGADTRTP